MLLPSPFMPHLSSTPPLPVAGELTDETFRQIADGQPVLLLHDGRPAAVLVDLDSWEEAELAATQAP